MSPRAAGKVVLAADLGTSSLKAALIGFDGELAGFRREGYAAESREPVTADAWWDAFARAAVPLAAAARAAGRPVAGLCLSGNGPSLVPVDIADEAGPVLHWHDERRLEAPEGAVSLFLPRAAWFARHRPAEYARCRWLLSSQEWLAWRLGADPAAVLPAPAYAPYFWDAAQLDAYGLDAAKFAPFAALGESLGALSPAAAETLGLTSGTPIAAGGPDFFMALLGVDATEEGAVCDRAGTSEGVNVCAVRPAGDPRLRSLPHLSPGLWNVAALLPTTGRLFEWFRAVTGQTDRPYADMMAEIAAAAPAAAGCFFPHLRTGTGLASASAFVSTAGLTTRAELGRAVVEAIGYLVREAVERLEADGFPVSALRLSGGQAKSPAWNRLKADLTGKVLRVPAIADGELAGDAAAALVALGEAGSLKEAARRVVRWEAEYRPDPAAAVRAAEGYAVYRSRQADMEGLFA